MELTYAIYPPRIFRVNDSTIRFFSGTKLLAIRKAAKMSRFDLCRAINFIVGTQAIISYEQGKTVPSIDVVLRIADALQVDVEELTDAEG